MRTIARSETLFIFLCLASLLFGCAPEARRQVVPLEPQIQAIPPLELKGLDQKIASLEKILLRQDLSKEDRMTAQNLLVAYAAIREDLKYPLIAKDYQKIIGLLYSNLAQMDENYFKSTRPPETAPVQSFQLFSEKRKKIISSYVSGDYQAVVDGCVELEKEFGTDAMTDGIAVLYALSLGETGKYLEALNLSKTLGPELEKTPGFVQLRAKSIEWQLAVGDQDDALKTYKKLTDSMKERETMVKLAEQKLPSEAAEGAAAQTPSEAVPAPGGVAAPAPGEAAAPGETAAPGEVAAKEPTTTDEVLKRADELAHNGEYDKAKLLLLQHRLRLQEGPETEAIDKALENLEITQTNAPTAETKEQQAAIASQETIKVASALIQEEKFEDALAKLEELQQQQALPPEAQSLQALAIEKIINRERNKAAKLFLLARNTADPAKKEELLKSSYSILKAVAEKYPSSPLNKKINDNMRSIEVELAKIKKQAG
jgi:tetratricopeptide (TPR) repeat protein